jgi:hypothetical protein
MFSALTRQELTTLGTKLDHGGLAAGDRLCPDRDVENEILALSAEVHDLAQRRMEAEASEPGNELGAEAEAGPEAG